VEGAVVFFSFYPFYCRTFIMLLILVPICRIKFYSCQHSHNAPRNGTGPSCTAVIGTVLWIGLDDCLEGVLLINLSVFPSDRPVKKSKDHLRKSARETSRRMQRSFYVDFFKAHPENTFIRMGLGTFHTNSDELLARLSFERACDLLRAWCLLLSQGKN